MARSNGHEHAFDELLDYLAREAVREMDADRSSIFLLDGARQELWSRVALGIGKQVIRFPADRGIAGHVATTGELLNVAQPYADPRFNPSVDRDTGYRTRNILCGPLRGHEGGVIGVLQVLNRRGGGPFVHEDLERFQHLLAQCSLALDNELLYEQLRGAEDSGAEPATRSPKVLLAEQDAEVIGRVREVLADDVVVLQATETSEIVQTAQAEKPDLVLLSAADDADGGVATCRALRACPMVRETPIIMLAQVDHPEQVVAAFEAGANDYILRPFSAAQLRAKTHTWLLRTASNDRRANTSRGEPAAG
jgi:CheY-like chemotaxis protein